MVTYDIGMFKETFERGLPISMVSYETSIALPKDRL